MQSRAATRYAKALFNLSREVDRLDAVRSDMMSLQRLLDECPEFRRFTRNALVPADQRRAALAALFEGRLEPVTLGFLRLLEEKQRLPLLGDICRHVEELCNEFGGIMNVTVRSARPLSAAHLQDIAARLKTSTGKDVRVTTETDETLLGGFSVQAGDHIFDSTVTTLFERFKQKLIHA